MSLYTLGRDLPHEAPVKTMGMDEAAVAQEAPPRQEKSADREAKQKALDALHKFIPAEVLAPYAMFLSLALEKNWNPVGVYVAFLVLTPIVAAFVLKIAARQDKKPIVKKAYYWRVIAAGFAFGIWALAIPENPFQQAIGGAIVGGALAIAVSPFLTLIDRYVVEAEVR